MSDDSLDLAFFFDNSDELFAIAGADGSMLRHNASWSRLLGHTAEQVRAAKLHELAVEGQDALRSALTLAASAQPGAPGSSTLSVALRGADERTHPCQVALDGTGDGRVRVRARVLPVEPPVSEEHLRMKGLLRLMESAPVVVWQLDRDGMFVLSEGGGLAALGLRPGQVVGMSALEIYKDIPAITGSIQRAFAGEEVQAPADVGPQRYATLYVPLRSNGTEVTGIMGIAIDVTAQHEAAEALREREQQLEEHRRALQAMSTPILQVWDGVLCVPVIGYVDQQRASLMMDGILAEVGAKSARHVILDLTGVDHIDTETASSFLKIMRAVVLLGARGVVAGIRPAVAQALVHLGLELAIDTHATLQDALRRCMRDDGAGTRRERRA